MVLETTVAGRTFEVDQKLDSPPDRVMVYAPQGQSGSFFNSQERSVRSLQFVSALTFAQDRWRSGQHMFKVGVDFQRSSFDGHSTSRGLDIVRVDGTLAERTTYREVRSGTGRRRHRAGDIRSGPLARQRPPEFGAGPPHRPRSDHRDDQFLTACRRGGQRAARRSGDPARRPWQVRRTHTADRRRFHAVRDRDHPALRRLGRGAW